MWRDESEGVAPIIWLYQTVDAQKEEVFFPDLLITLGRYVISVDYADSAGLVTTCLCMTIYTTRY